MTNKVGQILSSSLDEIIKKHTVHLEYEEKMYSFVVESAHSYFNGKENQKIIKSINRSWFDNNDCGKKLKKNIKKELVKLIYNYIMP